MSINPSAIRYIKLGKRGRWEAVSLERDELHFGHGKVPHEMALSLDKRKIQEFRESLGRDKRAAGDDAREIIDFYSLDDRCLWVTFARGHMWWTFADKNVYWIGGDGLREGQRTRKCLGRWKNVDVNGKPLTIETLSTKLTKLSSYRRTICSIDNEDYLLRRINGIVEPLLVQANKAKEDLIEAIEKILMSLRWQDFETLVDIMFSRSGWHRISELGVDQKLNDLVLENPITGEHCAVQIKSTASQKTFENYVEQIDETGSFDRIFFICHSPKGKLYLEHREDVHIWDARKLSEMAIRLGLGDWIIEKS